MNLEPTRRRRRLGVFVVALCVMSFADPALAGQAQEASIIGQVTDQSGAVLPGVTVTATSPALQVPQVVDVTNERGEYRLTPLPIGTYAVQYELPGFGTVRRENLPLTAGFTARVDIALRVGSLAESVTVSGAAPVVDVASTAARTQLTREALEMIPTSRSGIQSAMAQAPGVRTNLDFGSGSIGNPAFRTFGQETESWTSIEGVATTSPKTNSNGSGNYFDYASIEESTVSTVGNDADSPSSGVQFNAILKSGGNEFHGGGFWAQQSPRLQSDNLDAALRAQGVRGGNPVKLRWDLSGDFGGRIVRNKLWFYASGRGRREKNQILNAFMPDGSPVISPQLIGYSTQKVSYQMSPATKLIGFHQNFHTRIEGALSQFVPWASRQITTVPLHTSKLEWQAAVGNKFVSLQYGLWRFDVRRDADSQDVTTADQLTFRVTGMNFDAGPVRSGTTGPTDSFEGRKHAKGTLSWYKPNLFLGNHDFKTGFDFSNANAARLAFDRGAAGNYHLIFRNGVPFQFNALNYPVFPADREQNLSIYVQDSWTIARRLTLNLGVRYAHDRGFLPVQCRAAAPPPLDTLYPEQCFPRIEFKTFNPVVPRLHAAYDVTGDGRTVIKGGWGRFAHRWYADEINMANNNVIRTTVFRWNDRNGDSRFQPGEVNLDPDGPDFVFTTVQTQIGTAILTASPIANAVPNLNQKQPMQDEFSLSVERQLIPNFAIRLTGIYSRTLDTYRVQNNLRPYDVYNIPITNPDPGPDGRVGTADDPGTFVTYFDYPASLAGGKFQQSMLINDPRVNQTFKSVEVSASKRLANRWMLMASYSATKVHVPVVSNLGGTFAPLLSSFDPNAEINTARDTWEWLSRVTGAYTFPYDVLVSANFEHRSGEPFARTVFFTGGRQIPAISLNVEPIGTRRLPNLNILSLRAEKSLTLRPGQKVALRANVYNALNINSALTVTQQSGPAFLRPNTITPPRIAELSIQYTF